MKTCFDCGSEMVDKSGTYLFEPPPNIPGGTMEVPNAKWIECPKCGETMLPPALSDALEELCIKRQGLLLPVEIEGIRSRLGLTVDEMAARIEVSVAQYMRWERGRSIQDKQTDDLIRRIGESGEMK